MSSPPTGKPFDHSKEPRAAYCIKNTVKQTPMQLELQKETMENAPMGRMHGMPEVLTFGQNFISTFKLKRCLDIGTFTGCSALAWALSVPDDGEVVTFDIDQSNFEKFGVPIISKDQKTYKKIRTIEGPAVESLDKLISDGQAGTFDFAFIDADKTSYCSYYERAVTLLRSGGVILVDNSFFGASVYDPARSNSEGSIAVNQMNETIFNDDRTNSALLNLGDGTHVAFKK